MPIHDSIQNGKSNIIMIPLVEKNLNYYQMRKELNYEVKQESTSMDSLKAISTPGRFLYVLNEILLKILLINTTHILRIQHTKQAYFT